MTETKTLPRATPSTTSTPLKRHIVDRGDVPKGIPSAATVEAFKLGVAGAPQPQQTTLCGESWDRLGVSPDGALCEPCVAEYRRRHPTWPLPGGA